MIDQKEESNVFAEIIGWTAVNMLAISFMGVLLYLPNIPGIANNEVLHQIADVVGAVSLLGGGILIAGCQWAFLRNHLPQITGGGWVWVISGLVSSIGCFFTVIPIAILGLGDYPTELDSLFITILIVSGQIICLSIVQGLVLHSNKYKKAHRWVISNIIGYGLVVVFSYNLIYKWTDISEKLIILLTLLTIIATGVSGWEFIRAKESRDDRKVDNLYQRANLKYKTVNFVGVNLENKDLRGKNFDGADFRRANLRMAILEDASCEPVKVQKTGLLWLSFLISGKPYLEEVMKPANFSEADLTGTNLKHAKLRGANIHSAILRNANLSEAILINADLSEADLSNVNLSCTDMGGALLHSAILKNANLSKAILINADLSEADLSNANLSYTDMSGALLYKTNLEGANLTGAKLDDTDFESANLTNAILHDVDLRKAKYLNSADLTGATTSDGDTNDLVESEFASTVQSKPAGTTSYVFHGLKCPSCGRRIRDADTICPHCGRYLDAPLSKVELQALAQPYLEKAMKAFEIGKNLKGALVNANQAIKYIPASAEAHNLRGIILDALRNTDEAILEYQEAIRLDPNFEDAKANLASVQEEYLYTHPQK